jgi:putative membrane protein insertion efficiency factor
MTAVTRSLRRQSQRDSTSTTLEHGAVLASTTGSDGFVTSTVKTLARLPGATLVGLIRIYQYTLAPALPVLTMGRCGCRFAPTCSHYAVDAIRTHGVIRGVALAAVRLAKCTPLHPGGLDPVPPRARPATPVCRSVTLSPYEPRPSPR